MLTHPKPLDIQLYKSRGAYIILFLWQGQPINTSFFRRLNLLLFFVLNLIANILVLTTNK
jgi:hypothetical protein